MKIAIQGIEASFHHEAAVHYFGSNIEIFPCLTFEHVIQAVENEVCNFGLMAIENTLAGSLLPNYMLLLDSSAEVIGETYLRISQNLMALPGTLLTDLHTVHSHPVALQQCKPFLQNYPQIVLKVEDDTSLCAKEIAELSLKNRAAIASKHAAKHFGLEILAPDIQTHTNNITRFLAIRKKSFTNTSTGNKASLSFSLLHKVGSLAEILTVLASCKLNLSKIQSFPIIENPTEYRFFIDVEFVSANDLAIGLEAIKHRTENLKTLGIYTKSNQIN